jgi:hypothetical protein
LIREDLQIILGNSQNQFSQKMNNVGKSTYASEAEHNTKQLLLKKKDFKSSNLFIYIIVAEVERFTFNRGFIISLQAYRA